MAWTTPRTWLSGEVHLASNYNVYIKGNFNYLYGNRASGKYTGRGFTSSSLLVAHGMARPPHLVTIFDETSGTAWEITRCSGDTLSSNMYKVDTASIYSVALTNNSAFYVGKSGSDAATANCSGCSYAWIARGDAKY